MDDNDTSRQMVEQCYTKRKTTINPIVDWEDDDVWEFLNDVAKVPHCCLYDEGFTRLGCIGCPLQGREGMLCDFERWPGYKNLYIKAFDRMIKNHPGEITVASGAPADTSGGGNFSENGLFGAENVAQRMGTGRSRYNELVALDDARVVGSGAERGEPVAEVAPDTHTHTASLRDDWSGKQWMQMSAEWNVDFWIENS